MGLTEVAVQGLCKHREPRRPPISKPILANLTENHWFASRARLLASAEEQTAHVSPGYPYAHGVARSRSGKPGDARSDDAAGFNVSWEPLTALLYALLARRAFGSMFVAVCTGLLLRVHPFWIINTAEISDGVVNSVSSGTEPLACQWHVSVQDGGLVSSFLFGVALRRNGHNPGRLPSLPLRCSPLVCRPLPGRTPRLAVRPLLATLGLLNALLPWTFHQLSLVRRG